MAIDSPAAGRMVGKEVGAGNGLDLVDLHVVSHPLLGPLADGSFNGANNAFEPDVEMVGKGEGDDATRTWHCGTFGFHPKFRHFRCVNEHPFRWQVARLGRLLQQTRRLEVDPHRHPVVLPCWSIEDRFMSDPAMAILSEVTANNKMQGECPPSPFHP